MSNIKKIIDNIQFNICILSIYKLFIIIGHVPMNISFAFKQNSDYPFAYKIQTVF